MIRELALIVSMTIMMAAASSAGAQMKPPRDEDCTKWQLRQSGTANWVNAPKHEYWVCVSGDSKGRTATLRGTVFGSLPRSPIINPTDPTEPTDTPDPIEPTDPPITTGKGNNGIGNGFDPQPPGDPKENDT